MVCGVVILRRICIPGLYAVEATRSCGTGRAAQRNTVRGERALAGLAALSVPVGAAALSADGSRGDLLGRDIDLHQRQKAKLVLHLCRMKTVFTFGSSGRARASGTNIALSLKNSELCLSGKWC